MNITDPIFNPESMWTKESIHEQLQTRKFTARAISDEDALWWVIKEDNIRFDAISNGEDFYGRNIDHINKELIKRTLKGK